LNYEEFEALRVFATKPRSSHKETFESSANKRLASADFVWYFLCGLCVEMRECLSSNNATLLNHEEFLPQSLEEVTWKSANLWPMNTSPLRTLRGISSAGFAWKNENISQASTHFF
jgi:hypothetical protein